MANEQFDHWRVTANAVRLLSDAELLAEHSRCASAFALAVFAMEEVSKLILHQWSSVVALSAARGINFHIQKQSAVAHLLAAPGIIEEINSKNLKSMKESEAAAILAKSIFESVDNRWTQNSISGIVEKTKHISLYGDIGIANTELSSASFHQEDVTKMSNRVKRSLPLLTNTNAMKVARAMYVAWLTPTEK